jgi:polar amino acid transport system substrate-binding protein
VAVAFTGPAASTPVVPDFWNARERLPKPNAAALPRLRFLTTTDFQPFNYLDASGRLSGFNVDLARAVCAELDMGERCQIEAMPWSELEDALAEGRGEAIIAGIAITAEMREKYEFSRSYLQFPARFVMPAKTAVGEPLARELTGKRVGVLAGTAHEEMLRDLFPDVRIFTYTKSKWMLGDLKEGGIDAAFGDGMRLSFWLGSPEAHDCCAFAGGPYLAPEYLGQGMAIAVPRGKEDLVHALDYALQEIGTGGKFGELYLRYFPISFY